MKYCLLILIVYCGKLFARNPPPDSSCIPVITISENNNNVCAGTAITFHSAIRHDGTNGLYTWKKNNANAGANSNEYYTSSDLSDGDLVVCEYSCKTKCGVDTVTISNTISVHIINDVTPTLSIANYDPIICEGELTVFRATAFYGNQLPFYQWTLNNEPVATNSPVYSTSTITNGSKVECVLTVSNPACPGATKSTSSQLTIYVYPMVHPQIAITASKTNICRGEEISFTAKANGGAFPAFSWLVNGKQSGADAPSFISSTWKDGDTVSCIITIDQDSRCHTSTSAPSNYVVIHVQDFIDPTVAIATPTLDVCLGTNVTFTATPQQGGSYKFYQWYVNDRIGGNNSPLFTSNLLANGDKIYCTLSTNIPGCPITAKVPSNIDTVTVRDAPVITFAPPEISVLSGEAAQLNASIAGNAAYISWQPEGILLSSHSLTTSTLPLAQDTIFSLSITDSNGCITNGAMPVKVLHKLYMPSVFTPNNDGKNDLFRIPPGASISLNEFSVFSRWGNVVFSTTDIAKGWNGTYQGQKLDTGTYVYLIKGFVKDQQVTIKGTVTLLR